MHQTPEAAILSFARQRENPFPNFEDSREGGMELSQEDHLEAKAHTETPILLGQCKREKLTIA
jgi:hypothetical protein